MKNKKNIAVFLPVHFSLQRWHAAGILARDLEIFHGLQEVVDRFYFFSYGTASDEKYASLLPKKSVLICKPRFIPAILYSLLCPVLHSSYLRHVSYVRSIQMNGAWTALICKIIFRTFFVLRIGYEPLQDLQNSKASTTKKWLFWLIEYILYQAADTILVPSENIKTFICTTFRCNRNNLTIVPNAIDTEVFCPTVREKKERKKIAFVGRLEKQKNVESLISACSGTDWELMIIGDGSLRSALEQQAVAENVRARFYGIITNEQLPQLLGQCSLFILPSLYEGNPKALLEAMACQLPCIGTNVDGIRDIIQHALNGYLCEPNPTGLKSAIDRCIHDVPFASLLGSNARTFVINHHDVRSIVARESIVYI